MIIFTEYRDTQRWLYERLLAAGYPARRLALLFGGQDEQVREHVKNVFTADPELDLAGADAAQQLGDELVVGGVVAAVGVGQEVIA
ncbi:MAG: hypothetical protein ACRDRR_03105 [Pseudonocardiaceae bacterium]